MKKAKSRIKSVPQKKTAPKFLKKYLKHLPLLLLSLPFYGSVYFILTQVYPDKIRHFLLPNSYLPLQLTLFVANFFLFSYLFLKTRRGWEMSLFISLTLFLKLQLITNYLQLGLIFLGILIILELLLQLRPQPDSAQD